MNKGIGNNYAAASLGVAIGAGSSVKQVPAKQKPVQDWKAFR